MNIYNEFEIDGFDWDQANEEKNFKKHGVLAHEIEEVLLNGRSLLFSDSKHSHVEVRHIAFGQTSSGRLLAVAFTLRKKGDLALLRPISARPMHKKERLLYEKAVEEIEKP